MGAGRDIGVDHLLGDRPAEEHLDPALQLALGEEVAVILGTLHRVAEGGEATGDDRDFVHRIGVGERKGHQSMGRLVVGDTAFFVFVDDSLLLLEPRRHPLDPLVELLHPDGGLVVAGREERRLVDEIRQIGAAEPGGDPCHLVEVDRGIELHLGDVDLEDRLPTTDIWTVDEHVAVEATGPEEGGVERLWTVRGRHHDHAAVAPEAVHLHEQGVERLLALVVAADDARATGLSESVELVDEDDAGGLRLGLLEHVADAGSPDSDEHLHEVTAGEPKKRDTRLPRDRLGEKCLAGARGADEKHALGDVAAEDLILLRIAEELDDFAELFDRLVDPGHVVEGDPQVFLGVLLAAAAAERHRAPGPSQTFHHREEEEGKQAGQEEHREPAAPRSRGLLVAVGDAVLGEQP